MQVLPEFVLLPHHSLKVAILLQGLAQTVMIA